MFNVIQLLRITTVHYYSITSNYSIITTNYYLIITTNYYFWWFHYYILIRKVIRSNETITTYYFPGQLGDVPAPSGRHPAPVSAASSVYTPRLRVSASELRNSVYHSFTSGASDSADLPAISVFAAISTYDVNSCPNFVAVCGTANLPFRRLPSSTAPSPWLAPTASALWWSTRSRSLLPTGPSSGPSSSVLPSPPTRTVTFGPDASRRSPQTRMLR